MFRTSLLQVVKLVDILEQAGRIQLVGRRSVASLIVGSVIDFVPKPKCLIKLIDFAF